MAYRRTPTVKARLLDNRARILKAARTLVGEGGWSEAQVANVAAAAGMATGTVYRYFPSKADLFAEVCSDVSEREVEVLNEIANSDGTALLRLRSAVSTFIQRATRNPRLAYALIAEPCAKEIDEARLIYRAAISEVIRLIIESGQNGGEFDADLRPDVAASVIVGGFMEGLIGPFSPLRGPEPADVDAFNREVVSLADQVAQLASSAVRPREDDVVKLSRQPR